MTGNISIVNSAPAPELFSEDRDSPRASHKTEGFDITNPVLRELACAALRVSCHPERSEGICFSFAPRLGSGSIRPIATDDCQFLE